MTLFKNTFFNSVPLVVNPIMCRSRNTSVHYIEVFLQIQGTFVPINRLLDAVTHPQFVAILPFQVNLSFINMISRTLLSNDKQLKADDYPRKI